MYERRLTQGEHTRRFRITILDLSGWEVREEADSHVVSSRVYEDWHRVERARAWFQRAVGRLQQDGWTVEA